MGKSLVIVESPAKAKTINKYLGNQYVVKSSIGHIRDLPSRSLPSYTDYLAGKHSQNRNEIHQIGYRLASRMKHEHVYGIDADGEFPFEPLQLYAAAGYAVLYSNPRGSTSYGEEFGNLIHHDYPGHDYDDLMACVDDLLARGIVDPKVSYE
mgnify:CR=1 FL=1